MDKSRYSLNPTGSTLRLPGTLETQISDYEKLEQKKRQIEEQQQSIQAQLPITLTAEYGNLLSTLQLNNLTAIMPVISYKLELQRPFGSADVIRELNQATRVDSNRFVLAAVFEMFMESDLDDSCAQLDALTQQFMQDVAEYEKYQEELQAHFKAAHSEENVINYHLPSIQDTLLAHLNQQKELHERLETIAEFIGDAFSLPSDNSGLLQQISLFFNTLITEYKELNLTDELVDDIASVNLQPTYHQVTQHLNVFRTIRDLLLIIFGINFAVSESEEDRTLTLQNLARYQNFDAENFTAMCLIVRDGLGTIQNNIGKLDLKRHQKIQQQCVQLQELGQEIESKIKQIQSKLNQVAEIFAEQNRQNFINTMNEIMKAQNEIQMIKFEIDVTQKGLSEANSNPKLGSNIIRDLNETLTNKNTLLLQVQQTIKRLHPAFQSSVQSFKGLSEAEIFNILHSFFGQETFNVFKLIVNPQ